MPISPKWILALRLALGWIFAYAGCAKIFADQWSAAPYLSAAKTLPGVFAWLASPGMLPITNALNAWGLALIGISLLSGLLVRWSGRAGAVLMALYYLPVLDFPYIGKNALLVDEHVVYAIVLSLLVRADAGAYAGLDGHWRAIWAKWRQRSAAA